MVVWQGLILSASFTFCRLEQALNPVGHFEWTRVIPKSHCAAGVMEPSEIIIPRPGTFDGEKNTLKYKYSMAEKEKKRRWRSHRKKKHHCLFRATFQEAAVYRIASRGAASLTNHSRGRSKGSQFDLIKAAGGRLLHSNEASSQLCGLCGGAGLGLLTHRLFVSLPCLPSHTFK